MGEAEEADLLRKQLEDKINELSDAKGQIGKLRKTMLQQLTAISSITKPLFELDGECFGGTYQEREDGSNPFQEIQLAVEIVEAARRHLSGQSAMLDTPHLREQLGSLHEAIDALRDAAIAMRRDSLEAVGMPADSSSFEARSFPEDEPVAFIVDTAGFARELQGICERTAGRIRGLASMVQEADQVRGQAEEQLEEFRTNPKILAETARAEAEALQRELNELRLVVARLQESGAGSAHGPGSGESSLLLRAELERGQEDRIADLAEVRSLAGDICMLSGEMARGIEIAELESSRTELKAVLEDQYSDVGALASAAERVFLSLAEGLQGRVSSLQEEVAALRDAGAESAGSATVVAESREELAALQEEVAGLKQALQDAEQQRDQLQQQIDNSDHSASELESQLNEAQLALQEEQNSVVAAEDSLKRIQAELAAAEEARQRSREELAELEAAHTELGDSSRELKLQLAEAEQQLRTLETDRDALRQQLRDAERKGEEARASLRQAGKTEAEAQADAERKVHLLEERLEQSEKERDRARQDLKALRSNSDDSQRRVSELENEKDDAERSMRAHQMHTAELEQQINELKDKLAEQEQLFKDQQQSTLEAARERDEFKVDKERLEKELSEANSRAATSTADADRVQSDAQAELEKLKAQIDDQAEGRRNRETMFHNEKLALENQLDELRTAHNLLQEQFEEKDKAFRSLQRQFDNEKQARSAKESDATMRVREALEEVEKYRSEREEQELFVAQAKDLKKQADADIAAKDQQLEKMRNARDAMQRQMDESHRQIQAMEEKLKQLHSEHRLAESEWEAQRVASERERQDLAIKYNELEKKTEAERADYKKLLDEYTEQAQTIDTIKVEYDDTVVKLNNREQDVDSLERRLERMQKELSDISAARSELADKLAGIEQRDEQQRRQIANLERQQRDEGRLHEEQIAELKAYLHSAREQIIAAKQAHEELTERDREIIASLMDKLKRSSSQESEEVARSASE